VSPWSDAQGDTRGFIPFASNGAGEWYGIDSGVESPAFVLMPSIGTEWGAAMLLGATWDEFWETLKRGNLFDQVYQPAQK
jgi:hypothetical protein